MESDNEYRKVESYQVSKINEEVRLSDFAVGIFKTISSRKGIKKAIKKGLIKINGEAGYSGDFIRGGEIIDLYQADLKSDRPIVDIPIELLYEDDYLAVVYKPPGIIVSGNKKRTLGNALPLHLERSNQQDALGKPQAIHRLDYPTSGVLLVGKTSDAVLKLNRLFERRDIQKKYLAVTIGESDIKGTIETEIDGKTAQTDFNVLKSISSDRFRYLNLVELRPHTGRRHQLRVHMAELGTPIFGDAQYGIKGLIHKGKGLYLHASSLSFRHPFTDEMIYLEASLPKKFLKLFPDI